jgi:threonyl-tRNA synthetase
MGVMIEHFGGSFPTWLSPEQVRVLPVSEKHATYGAEVLAALRSLSDAEHVDIRATLDDSSESLGKKIRAAKVEKIPYVLVIGDKEVEDKTVTVESRDEGKLEPVSVASFVEKITKEIKERK